MAQGMAAGEKLAPFWRRWETVKATLQSGFSLWIPEFFKDVADEQLPRIHRLVCGGKGVRGGLTVLVSEALGGSAEEAVPYALALECVQAASLIHDDFVDRDIVRRAHPALWVEVGPRQAVLLGDVMFATAVERITGLNPPAGLALSSAIGQTARGASQEFPDTASVRERIRRGLYDPKQYERLIHLKTGALFGAATQLGAMAAGRGDRVSDAAFDFGCHLGMAYQVADDLCDIRELGINEPEQAVLGALAPAFFYFSRHPSPESLLRI